MTEQLQCLHLMLPALQPLDCGVLPFSALSLTVISIFISFISQQFMELTISEQCYVLVLSLFLVRYDKALLSSLLWFFCRRGILNPFQ